VKTLDRELGDNVSKTPDDCTDESRPSKEQILSSLVFSFDIQAINERICRFIIWLSRGCSDRGVLNLCGSL
jgi:hypothetical protein